MAKYSKKAGEKVERAMKRNEKRKASQRQKWKKSY